MGSSHRWHVAMAAAVAISVLAMLPGAAGAAPRAPAIGRAVAVQPAAFGTAVRVMRGHFSGIAAVMDNAYHIHIIGTKANGLWYATDRTGHWVRQRLAVSTTSSVWFDPAIALDSHDHVFIAAAHNPCGDCTPGGSDGISLWSDRGRPHDSFPSSPLKLAGNGAGETALKVNQGKIYLAFVTVCCQPGPPPRVMLATNASGSWTTRQVAKHGASPSLRIGSDGRPRIAYATVHGLRYAVGLTPIGPFSTSLVPGTTFDFWFDDDPILALDGHDRPSIAWNHQDPDQPEARWARLASDGWHGPQTVSANPDMGPVGFDNDTLGRANVALQNGAIHDLRHTGSGWHDLTVSTASEIGSIVVRRGDDGAVIVAWAPFNGGLWLDHN